MKYKYINTDYIMEAMGGEVSVISSIIDLFKEQVDETNLEMDELLRKKDYLSLGLLAHKVKSSATIMGMEELTVMLKNFELKAKASEDIDKYLSYIEQFKEYSAAAIIELDDFVNTLNGQQ